MWLSSLFFSGTMTANAVMVIAVVSLFGLAFGQIRFGPVQLGIAGPLFIGPGLGHFGFEMNMDILGFARDFGLILLVYAIGIRVGPGFFSAFKKDGAVLNAFAVSIVLLGAPIAVGIHFAVGVPLGGAPALFPTIPSALGVLLGSVPVYVPGVPAPLSLGLAGGPVVVAIILARIDAIGPLNWTMTPDTIDTVRELGVSLFIACVGIYAGKSFVATVMNGDGLLWMGRATLITFIPIFLVGLVARRVFKVNYLTLCGVLAGSATDAPALCFANAMNPSQAQSTGYAAVYPVPMFLRILSPQIILGLMWVAGH